MVGLADLAFGLLARDLPLGTGHLDSHRDRADDQRGEHQVGNGVNDEADHRADHQERDQYAGPMAASLNQRIRHILSEEKSVPSRDIT